MFKLWSKTNSNDLQQQDFINYSTSSKGLWNPRWFTIISMLFSFLPVVIMYSINCKRLGQKNEGKKFIIISVIGFIIMVIALMFLPNIIGKSLAMGINASIGAHLARNQIDLYKQHIERGGKKASLTIPIIICSIMTLGMLLPILYTKNIPDTKEIFSGDEIYYTQGVKKDDVVKLGKFLEENQFFNDDKSIVSIKLDKKQNEIYILSLITDKKYLEDPQALRDMSTFINAVSSDVFNNSKVELHLCDNRFNTLKVVNP